MHLLLGQLVYTSFTGSGFRLLASKHVPKEVQQAFIQQIVSSYWDSYNPPPPEYSAVYLHQVTPEHTLFGWLYNDGVDDVGRSNVPYFICYYLAEPLFNFQLANIFTCLENGPIALINRYSSIPSLETKEIADLWSYQGVKPGVAVPFSIRKHSYVALKQRQLLNLFISVYEQEMIVEPGSQTYEQQIGNLSIYTSYIIEGFNIDAAINQKTAIIHGNTIQPYQKNQHILGQLHKKTKAHNRLSLLPKSLLFKTKEPIKAWLEQHLLATKLQKKTLNDKKKPSLVVGSNPVAVVNNDSYDRENETIQSFWSEQTNTGSHKTNLYSLFLAYRNSQVLLKVGITATILALIASIYGIIQANTSAPNNSESHDKNSSTF